MVCEKIYWYVLFIPHLYCNFYNYNIISTPILDGFYTERACSVSKYWNRFGRFTFKGNGSPGIIQCDCILNIIDYQLRHTNFAVLDFFSLQRHFYRPPNIALGRYLLSVSVYFSKKYISFFLENFFQGMKEDLKLSDIMYG